MEDNFFKVSNEFINYLPKLTGSATKVYILFKRMINESKNKDEVWPSYSYIQKNTGLSRRIISNAINELIKFGWINEIDKGFNSVNHYHVNDASRVNIALLEKRSRAKITLPKKEIVGQKSNVSREENAPSRANIAIGRAESELEVGQKVNSNNTNITILKNNTKNNTKEEDNNINNNINILEDKMSEPKKEIITDKQITDYFCGTTTFQKTQGLINKYGYEYLVDRISKFKNSQDSYYSLEMLNRVAQIIDIDINK